MESGCAVDLDQIRSSALNRLKLSSLDRRLFSTQPVIPADPQVDTVTGHEKHAASDEEEGETNNLSSWVPLTLSEGAVEAKKQNPEDQSPDSAGSTSVKEEQELLPETKSQTALGNEGQCLVLKPAPETENKMFKSDLGELQKLNQEPAAISVTSTCDETFSSEDFFSSVNQDMHGAGTWQAGGVHGQGTQLPTGSRGQSALPCSFLSQASGKEDIMDIVMARRLGKRKAECNTNGKKCKLIPSCSRDSGVGDEHCVPGSSEDVDANCTGSTDSPLSSVHREHMAQQSGCETQRSPSKYDHEPKTSTVGMSKSELAKNVHKYVSNLTCKIQKSQGDIDLDNSTTEERSEASALSETAKPVGNESPTRQLELGGESSSHCEEACDDIDGMIDCSWKETQAEKNGLENKLLQHEDAIDVSRKSDHIPYDKVKCSIETAVATGVLRDETENSSSGTMKHLPHTEIVSTGLVPRVESPASDSQVVPKPEPKKSRKQHAPKRIVRDQVCDSPPAAMDKDVPESSVNVTGSQSESEDCATSEGRRMEHARKRYIPKRILTDRSDQDMEFDSEELELKTPDKAERKHSSKSSSKKRRVEEDVSPSMAMEQRVEFTSPEFDFTLFDSRLTHSRGLNGSDWSPSPVLPSLVSQPPVPMLTVPDDSPVGTGVGSNLIMMKKLREIRFNRYRKISLFEKKQIAAHAKIHGVSAAANYYGVSKSAVSLWTRTEFKEVEEDSGKKRKNCMIGNDKFETLVKRVKFEKTRKFKGLSKEEKQDVVKYAKLIGVREMARCLDIALGTVSGWMRQFPYRVRSPTEDEEKEEPTGPPSALDLSQSQLEEVCETGEASIKLQPEVKEEEASSSPLPQTDCNVSGIKTEVKSEPGTDAEDDSEKRMGAYGLTMFAALNDTDNETRSSRSVLEESTRASEMNTDKIVVASKAKDSVVKEGRGADEADLNCLAMDLSVGNEKVNFAEHAFMPGLQQTPDVEQMIAETYVKPDVEKCYTEIKDQLVGTTLEVDKFFEVLYKRVAETRIDRYKSLKASEKLEVVRYAKRVGVRRIAKLLDLATGTLSGWITKYQHHLGLTMDGGSDGELDLPSTDPDVSCSSFSMDCSENSLSATERPGSSQSPDTASNASMRSSSILDNEEKAEVTALKFLLKDQFPVLKKKIEIARKMKFKNVTHADKLEIVKCAKLVGIRPTARVFNFPLGTLSGWITKYQQYLGYAFQDGSQQELQVVDLSVPATDSTGVSTESYSSAMMSLAGSEADAAMLAQQYLNVAYQSLGYLPVPVSSQGLPH